MFVLDEGWRGDFISDAHQERRTMTKNSISHYVKREIRRRVSSSSSSEEVFITDCCWASFLSSQSFVLCALSNGSVCLLNTVNLSKTYLIRESEKGGGHELRGHHPRDRRGEHLKVEEQRLMQLVAIDFTALDKGASVHPLPLTTTTTTCTNAKDQTGVLCVVLDGWVQLCHVDSAALVTESRRPLKNSPLKVLELPRVGQQEVLFRQVRFSPSADRICLLQSHLVSQEGAWEEPRRAVVSVVAVLKREVSISAPGYQVELGWRQVSPHRDSAAYADLIRFWGWWDVESFLCVWASGCLQLLSAKDLSVLGEARLFPSMRSHSVLLATTTPCTASSFATEGRPAAAEAHAFFLVTALKNNVIASFNVSLVERVENEAKKDASEKVEDGASCPGKIVRTLIIKPTQKTFYTEDIPVSSLALFYVHSWTLCVSLESGAVLFIDATTMDLLVHRPLKRQSSVLGPLTWDDWGYITNRPPFSCLLLGKPLSVVAWDHHTAIVLKP